ncbi:LysE family translocator [Mesonia maritima]|uniref:Threonine/homoserine/homoserine lactone efflux protein n=1 Tax=Mesonia maritima TaxID=1793873 RepID=A0ABU1K490_9FLAO|nr:LysE family translocator [Mesonia maritima]MDR6300414.1 threonine/homoserine/homoserine lactone efflux protein [Mesonia maritima]
MNVEILISFTLAVFALAISPGPDNIFVLVQSIRFGKKPALAVVAGLMTGCLIHTSLVAFGVSLLIVKNETLFTILKIFGACYLLFLAYKVFKSSDAIKLNDENLEAKSHSKLFRQGFIMNVLNPKVSLFFLALFPGFLFNENLSETLQFFILGGIFILASFVVFGSIALLAGSLKKYIEKHPHSGRFLKWLQIFVFIGIALFILI